MEKGITLIETILYVGLLSLILSITLPIFVGMKFWQMDQKQFLRSISEHVFIESRVRFMIKNSSRIVVPRQNDYSNIFEVENQDGLTQTIIPSRSTDNLTFLRVTTDGFETILFNFQTDGLNFGTTTILYDL